MDQRILIVRFGSLGDILLTTPTVLNLKLARPNARITYLTKARFASLVERFDGVDEVAALPDRASTLDLIKLLYRLDSRNFDLVVDLHGNPRSWFTRKFVTANRRVVYPKRRLERRAAVTKKQIPQRYPHTIDLYNSALKEVGIAIPCRRPLFQPGQLDPGELPFENGAGPIAVFAPGAAHPNKQWPIERFAETAEMLHRSTHARIAWAVTTGDAGQSGLEGKLPKNMFAELIDFPVEKLAAVIAQARVTVANDSGIAHLSSAVGTPVVAIFGPTHPVLGFAPRGMYDQIVEVDEPCRPCSRHGKKPCYREERFCFTRIHPTLVAERAAELLQSTVRSHKGLIVDRDGTVIVNKNYLSNPEGVELIEGAAEGLKAAAAAGYKLVIVSNQSGIARGYFSVEDVEKVNNRMLELLLQRGVEIEALYYCPHHPTKGSDPEFTRACHCRKPLPDMAEQAARELSLNLRQSVVIGDSMSDLNLGRVIGARPVLVRTGYGREVEKQLKDSAGGNIFPTFNDLSAAVASLFGA